MKRGGGHITVSEKKGGENSPAAHDERTPKRVIKSSRSQNDRKNIAAELPNEGGERSG